MKQNLYIAYAVVMSLALFFAGCDTAEDNLPISDDMVQIDGIALGLGDAVISAEDNATTRASVDGVDYVVNTGNDPTSQTHFIANRATWSLDFHLFNGKNTLGGVDDDPYTDASFNGGKYDSATKTWKPNPANKQLYFPNYFKPHVAAWLYPVTKDAVVAIDQSTKEKLVDQDILFRTKSQLNSIAKKISIQMSHKRAMINFKFENIVRGDIDEGAVDEGAVKVKLGDVTYTPYKVSDTGTLEYLLILPETATTSDGEGMFIKYSTKSNAIQQSIQYKLKVTLNSGAALGSNNCYCFTLSGKNLSISPVTIVNWTTGEPVSGEYVAVTAYPTFKGPANKTYYFYYDNKLTEGGSPKLQAINFNNDGECTIKPDGRIVTHIFKTNSLAESDWETFKLVNPVILGNAEKMYIDLTKDKDIEAFK